jgi:NADH-quinone oxidoreductase subunit J
LSLTYIFFTVLAILAIASAISTVANKNPVASAISLVFHFFMLAGLYLTLQAQFIAIIQVLVYAGAIMVLVVFVIMLLNLGNEENIIEKYNLKKILGILLSCAFVVELIAIFFISIPANHQLSKNAVNIGTVQNIGNSLFSENVLAIEAIGLLLLVAVLGAIVLAKRKLN